MSEPKDSRTLSKEIGLYEAVLGGNVAFWFESLNKNYRNSYVKHHIPFVMLPTQIFLPFLGILFTKKFTNTKGNARTKLSSNADKTVVFIAKTVFKSRFGKAASIKSSLCNKSD